ncbi:MCE family protein [Actinomadura parmotrematis]|uniref:MCE family protein n=1 Tax=Actinomadura parmotrematis TaxID=2864039 RepID=A0ABS7FMQ8_9ACTN|nr:MCE family protein [Actinomadura parmotrematis]MBW8481669.1 MCE family protein [Actinomadura parmotrematis]
MTERRRQRRDRTGVAVRRLAGVAFLLVPALLAWLAVAIYDKKFTDVAWVTLRTASAGSEMHPHADVKLRGVVIGEVRSIGSDGGGATLRLAIQPDKMRLLPANVTARMLPTTLFGQRYVALVPPARPSTARLAAHGTISQDRSANAIEVQRVLDDLMPLLTAVRPAELSATLTAVSQALDGRGTELGRTLVELDAYLRKLNPNLPALNQGIRDLAEVSAHYSEAVPDILQALNDATYTSNTIAAQRANLAALYASVTDVSDDLTTFVRENSANLIRVSAQSRASLEILARYSPELPCTLAMLADFVPLMDRVLGKGTANPGLHVDVRTLKSKGAYRPGKDRPVYNARGGPHCYPVAYGTAQPAASRAGLGVANSPQENRLVNELIAARLGEAPEALPDWSSVLLGPLYRGTEVKIG